MGAFIRDFDLDFLEIVLGRIGLEVDSGDEAFPIGDLDG